MKKLAILMVLTLILVSSLMISACGGDDDKETSTPEQTQTSVTTPTATGTTIVTPVQTSTPIATATSTTTSTPTSSSGDTLADIVRQGEDIGPVKYEQVISSTGGQMNATQTMKVWQKNGWSEKMKMRYETTQEGQTIVILLDLGAKNVYMYYPDQNVAITLDMSQVPETPMAEYQDVYPTYVGTETVDGKTCSIYEWTQEDGQYKYWLWDKYKFPIKTQITTSEQVTTGETKNIERGDFPDSMFKLADGVKIMTMEEFVGGMGDLFK